jgi:Protein of unknown function (DUF3108)
VQDKPQARHSVARWRCGRCWIAALTVAVTLVHLWFTNSVLPTRLGDGVADGFSDRRPKRIDVAFVRELAPAVPAAAPIATRPAAPAPRPRAPRAVVAAAPAASAAAPEPQVKPEPEPAAATPASESSTTVAAAEPASAASAASAASSELPPLVAPSAAQQEFAEWPPSTRLTYLLTGNYKNGPVEGQARVEWLRAGTRYQVFMEASIGPPFAPLITRRDSSEGEITAEGLSPRRYDQETKVVLQNPRRQSIFLDTERIRLPNGREEARPVGVQDSVSQFVHLTWLFTTHPEWLTPGKSFELRLALPRQVSLWIYDVVGEETQYTSKGPVQTFHVKPRRESASGGDLAVELWVAPSLQYLPVRIAIKQDAETYIDLLMDRLPEQAAPTPPPGPAPTPVLR